MTYRGGKEGAGTYQRIINLIRPHEHYGELFLGGGAVFRHIRPARSAIVMDRDQDLIAKWADAVPEHVTVRHGCAIDYLERVTMRRSAFLYLDPPYLPSTLSRNGGYYRHELTEADHVRLLRAIRRQRCMIMISGYPSALYDDMLAGWSRVEHQVSTRGGQRTEALWFNYPLPTELHDYRYIGGTFRDRERITRRQRRWLRRLEAMPALERNALLAAVTDRYGDGRGHRPEKRYRQPATFDPVSIAVPGGIDDKSDTAVSVSMAMPTTRNDS